MGQDQILQSEPMILPGAWALPLCYLCGGPGAGKSKLSQMDRFDDELPLVRFEDGECQSPFVGV